jgi:metal-responsive CopG/Arc/MetJ family transcriptional regulator
MPSEKPKILFVIDKALFDRVEDYRFENRINNRSEAIRRLIEAGLESLSKAPRKKPRSKD